MFVFFDAEKDKQRQLFLETDSNLESIRSFFKILKKLLNKGKIETK
ncbi:hypothetical protein predicted by Glimmer/Critica [Streptococcus dysgalactiae subsp. equisimilis AC-2713]|uniref:MarR family transcriptional regulator n=1 Tax=Streptococcus dysgalactiae subsp. equisimilis AC-2713 TaxID=759913 RepID=A0AB33R8R1_STREQ|nr:hypothetical protein SDE12394_07875 [Streptococcus dysgalactiae subsp. equisimilis ATCC 12394]CCI63114.1 hypothetical protein predicted by Glimmer/Critica [Streptococcus dysgalactiae subsp. equisimilis AC-2713]